MIAGIDLNGVNDGSVFGQAIERSDGLYFSLVHVSNNGQPTELAALSSDGTSLSFAPLVPLAMGNGAVATDGVMVGQLSILYEAQIQLNAFDSAFATTADEALSTDGDVPRLAARGGQFLAAWDEQASSPRFALLDSVGKTIAGPSDGDFSGVRGGGAAIATGCGFVEVASGTNETAVRFATPGQSSEPTFTIDASWPVAIAPWPYDSSSLVWWNDANELHVVSDSGAVRKLDGASGWLVPTSFGLVVLSYSIGQPPTVVTVSVVAADGSLSTQSSWALDTSLFHAIVAGELAGQLALVWTEQPNATSYTEAHGMLISCDP